MRILVVGAGATGGFYGGMLLHAGRDITFLLREASAARVRGQGLTLRLHTGEPFTVQPPVMTAAELRAKPQPFDLVILTTKSYQLEAAMEDCAPAVGAETALLPILNGMHQLQLLQERFGKPRVLGGSVRIVSDVDPEGAVVQMTPLDEFNYGELSGERTERILALDAVLQNAGFSARLQPDIIATLWQKWWILASMGTICVLGDGTIGQVTSAPHGRELALAVLRECTAIATANGYPPEAAMYRDQMARFTEENSSLTSSMYRDMRKGAPVEADHILGDLLRRASGVPAPLVMAAYVRLKVYEAARGQ